MTIAANLAARTARHDFISTKPDVGGDRSCLGYPDECRDLTLFADSLAALVTDNAWMIQPFTQKMELIAVDFASETQEEAEASLVNGWNGSWETPMGAVTTVRSRHETNEQNALIERHLTLIATGFTMRDFYWFVIEKLRDSHSCVDADCEVCAGRIKRNLADVFMLFADGMGQIEITLFSKWIPSADLPSMLAREGMVLRHRPLSDIPAEDLEANAPTPFGLAPKRVAKTFCVGFGLRAGNSRVKTLRPSRMPDARRHANLRGDRRRFA